MQVALEHNNRIPVQPEAQTYPLWFLQQRLWVEDPVHSDSAIYNLPLNLRIQGRLDHEAVDRSLTEIVRRHEILRSSFFVADGQLIQKVSAFEPLKTSVVDLSHLEEHLREDKAREMVREETLKPFDLSSGPILRGKLLRVAADDHILVLTTHHLVCDDWSAGIFRQELSALYQAFSEGKPSPLPDLAFTYSDFLRWQKKLLEGRALERRLSFWRERLRGGNDFHHLATDHPRASTRSNRGCWEAAFIRPELTTSLRTLSQREGVTLFMVLVAAFQALLRNYSGDTDIGLGSCAANRGRVELQGLIGRFANDLVLRTDLSDNPRFGELLKRVRKTALEAYSYQDVPFGSLVEELSLVRDPSRNPLFQVMFILQDAPKNELRIPGLNWFEVELPTAKYDLNVFLKIKDRIEISIEYNTDLFESATIRQILDSYRVILEAAAADPNVHISELRVSKPSVTASVHTVLAKTPNVKPRTPVEVQLVELWESVLETRPIGIQDTFFQLGGGSLLATQVCSRIERTLGKRLSLATFFQASTIEQLAEILSDTNSDDQMVKIVPLQPCGSEPPFFCPCINIGAGPIFLPLIKYLGSEQPFLGLVPENRLTDSLPVPYTMEGLARHMVAAIRRRQPEGPYFMGGFCGDGVLAFETARQLIAQGEDVPLLALFEAQTPDRYQEFQPKRTQLRSIIERLAARQLVRHLRTLRGAGTEQVGSYILNRLRDIVRDLNDVCWQASIDWNLRTNHGRLRDMRQVLFVAEKSYRPQAYAGDVALFRCSDYRVTPNGDRYGGWPEIVSGSLELHEVPGDHLGMLDEPNVQVLAEKLSGCLRGSMEEDQKNTMR